MGVVVGAAVVGVAVVGTVVVGAVVAEGVDSQVALLDLHQMAQVVVERVEDHHQEQPHRTGALLSAVAGVVVYLTFPVDSHVVVAHD